ncbi:hypothetical protein CC78DRAFT_620089 [Lojkania enalia]|uniref:Mediator of RNA polymerase II transcription subunit 13 n=1 Tax=Lojkania enalia TaxID=147567 RepID=A0A9P4K2H2_9PLEO|nr:hypothetical protein CC78DRAFT_620089 [Didymosphaeria enalia]
MEFLKNCNTNAQAIADFEAVAFRAFSVHRNPTQSSAIFDDRSPSDDLRVVEAELRRGQHLVVQDASRPWLWFFRAAPADKASQNPLDLPVLDGYHFQTEQSGLMKAFELARPPPRTAHPNAPSSASTNSPLATALKGAQAGGSRPSHPSEQQQLHDSCALYELFTSAIVASISYYLVRDHNTIALNYRTFVSEPTYQQQVYEDQSNNVETLYWLTNVNVYWLSSGFLIVSFISLPNPAIHSLLDVNVEDARTSLVGRCVRVAPNGILAQIASFDDPLDTISEDVHHRLQRKRIKIGPAEQSIGRWKSVVTRWLAWKGYSLTGLDKNTSWVKIRFPQGSPFTASSPAPYNSSRDVLWPRALCFFYEDSAKLESLPSPEGPLDWFETENSRGYRDPIDVAQEWFLGKPERDKALEARRRAKKAEEEAAKPKEENHSLLPSSPLNFRAGAYGDLQAVSGVYPTPPDGVAPGTAVSTSDHPSISGTTTSTILAPGGSNPAINLSVPHDSAVTGEQQLPATSPGFPQPFDQFNASTGNDDLFEDMDEDGYDGNGVTDADFNFFDEPDGDDMDMLDVSTVQDSKPSVAAQKTKTEKEVPPQPSPVVKEESSDPLAALENALATAGDPNEEDPEDSRMEERLTEQFSPLEKQADCVESQGLVRQTPEVLPAREPTPPLSPQFVKKKLLPSPREKAALRTPKDQTAGRHHDSVFEPVRFNQKITLSDAKYHDGRFSFLDKQATDVSVKKEKPKEISKRPASLRDLPLLTKLRYSIGVASAKGIPAVKRSDLADSDLSDTSSETSSILEEDVEDEISVVQTPHSAGLIFLGKRKLPTDGGNATPKSTTSFAESMTTDSHDIVGLQIDEAALTSFEPSPWDWSLSNAPPPIELSSNATRTYIPSFSPIVSSMPGTPTSQPDVAPDIQDEKPLSGKDTISIAQMVTDQIVSTTLDLLHENKSSGATVVTRSPPDMNWQSVVKGIFPKVWDCQVLSLIAMPDVFPELPPQAKGQTRPASRRTNEGVTPPGYYVNQVPPPYVRVRRAEILWDLLPPALPFWETLGLSPCSAPKNIVTFSIYPHSDSLKLCLENFLLNIQIAYEGCKLGNHARVSTVTEYEGGLVPCKLGSPPSTRGAFKALRDTCIQLGELLAGKHVQMQERDDGQKIDAFVIYMIDPFESSSAVWELCSAFWSLYQAYDQVRTGRAELQKPDLVLQIVPIKYIASFEEPIVLDASTYVNLAREVYDRCPPSAPSGDKTPLSIYSAPSFQLEETLPRTIPFKLNAEPPQDLLKENSYIHLGYAVSLDGVWVTAAWTDSCGKSKYVMSYNLGTRVFGEVAKEIWQTTIEILSARRVTWRVCIAKAGVMGKEELDTWMYIACCPTQLNLFITLLTVDVDPPFKFTPTASTNQPPNSNHASSSTPVSTPQAGVSPENHGLTPAATPSEPPGDPSADPDARLVDVTDESWSIILSHRLHNSNSTVEFRPCLISGLLVKRGSTPNSPSPSPLTPDPEPGPILVGVNILWVGAVGSTRNAVSPFPPSTPSSSIDSPSSVGMTTPLNNGNGNTMQTPGLGINLQNQAQERTSTSLMWTPTTSSRSTAENLLKEVLAQYRGLGTLARLRGIRGTREGCVPWHIAVARRGVEGLGKVVGRG